MGDAERLRKMHRRRIQLFWELLIGERRACLGKQPSITPDELHFFNPDTGALYRRPVAHEADFWARDAARARTHPVDHLPHLFVGRVTFTRHLDGLKFSCSTGGKSFEPVPLRDVSAEAALHRRSDPEELELDHAYDAQDVPVFFKVDGSAHTFCARILQELRVEQLLDAGSGAERNRSPFRRPLTPTSCVRIDENDDPLYGLALDDPVYVTHLRESAACDAVTAYDLCSAGHAAAFCIPVWMARQVVMLQGRGALLASPQWAERGVEPGRRLVPVDLARGAPDLAGADVVFLDGANRTLDNFKPFCLAARGLRFSVPSYSLPTTVLDGADGARGRAVADLLGVMHPPDDLRALGASTLTELYAMYDAETPAVLCMISLHRSGSAVSLDDVWTCYAKAMNVFYNSPQWDRTVDSVVAESMPDQSGDLSRLRDAAVHRLSLRRAGRCVDSTVSRFGLPALFHVASGAPAFKGECALWTACVCIGWTYCISLRMVDALLEQEECVHQHFFGAPARSALSFAENARSFLSTTTEASASARYGDDAMFLITIREILRRRGVRLKSHVFIRNTSCRSGWMRHDHDATNELGSTRCVDLRTTRRVKMGDAFSLDELGGRGYREERPPDTLLVRQAAGGKVRLSPLWFETADEIDHDVLDSIASISGLPPDPPGAWRVAPVGGVEYASGHSSPYLDESTIFRRDGEYKSNRVNAQDVLTIWHDGRLYSPDRYAGPSADSALEDAPARLSVLKRRYRHGSDILRELQVMSDLAPLGLAPKMDVHLDDYNNIVVSMQRLRDVQTDPDYISKAWQLFQSVARRKIRCFDCHMGNVMRLDEATDAAPPDESKPPYLSHAGMMNHILTRARHAHMERTDRKRLGSGLFHLVYESSSSSAPQKLVMIDLETCRYFSDRTTRRKHAVQMMQQHVLTSMCYPKRGSPPWSTKRSACRPATLPLGGRYLRATNDGLSEPHMEGTASAPVFVKMLECMYVSKAGQRLIPDAVKLSGRVSFTDELVTVADADTFRVKMTRGLLLVGCVASSVGEPEEWLRDAQQSFYAEVRDGSRAESLNRDDSAPDASDPGADVPAFLRSMLDGEWVKIGAMCFQKPALVHCFEVGDEDRNLAHYRRLGHALAVANRPVPVSRFDLVNEKFTSRFFVKFLATPWAQLMTLAHDDHQIAFTTSDVPLTRMDGGACDCTVQLSMHHVLSRLVCHPRARMFQG